MYIHTDEYAKKALLDATSYSDVEVLNQMIAKLGYKGPAVYLPPQYFSNPDDQVIYVSKEGDVAYPKLGQLPVRESAFFVITSSGMMLKPSGLELVGLFERTLETNFARVDFEFLEQNFSRLFVESLEIAETVDVEAENNRVIVKLEKSAFRVYDSKDGQSILLGSPISSAIACVLAKATGRIVVIRSQQTRGRDVFLEYQLIVPMIE